MSGAANPPVRERLIVSGATLFAERGFGGVSVREICTHASTSSNMIHHYFGNKQGLLDAIIERFDTGIFTVPLRLLEGEPGSSEDFAARMTLLFETTLESYIEHRTILMVVVREQTGLATLERFFGRFTEFLERAKVLGLVRPELDSEMIVGAMLDRALNQVQFAPWIERTSGIDVLTDLDYRQRWCRSNIDLFLHGLMA